MAVEKLTAARLREVLHYDPDTGIFIRCANVFAGQHASVKIACAGDVAGYYRPDGYLEINVDGCRYYGHRLAWLYMTGAWPAQQIDHRDNDPSNNRWSNLRDVSPSVNQENKASAYRNSKTGVRGITVCKQTGRFIVFIKRRNVGRFRTLDDAIAARAAAEREFFAPR